MTFRYLSVCSGIEAASVAWHDFGWEAAAFSEIEDFPRAVLAHHYPAVPLHGDFTTIGENDYGAIDLLVGGTPCQAFSVAGLRKGFADSRGNLTLEFIRLAQRKKPRWILWENVPGVLSVDRGRAFGSFLGGLAECGYGFAYRVLDAQYFGVPQRRRRVFVVGYLGDWRPPAAVLFERESLCGYIAPRREEGKGAPSATDESLEECGYEDGIAGTLTARDWKGIGFNDESKTVLASGNPTSGTLMANCGTKLWLGNQEAFSGDYHLIEPIPIHSQAIRSEKGGVGRDDDGRGNGLGIGRAGDPANTLTCSEQHAVACIGWSEELTASVDVAGTIQRGGDGGRHDGVMQADMKLRRFTPKEAERLQGFPDDYTLIEYNGRPAPDGLRYKAIGNSMASPVMRWLGSRIRKIEAMTKGAA